jgi:hypothetical protein
MNEHEKHIVVVHPDDMNLADAKSLAADYGATVVGNPFCPRGKAFLIDPRALNLTPTPDPHASIRAGSPVAREEA